MAILRLTHPPRWYPLAKREWQTVVHSRYVWLLTLFQVVLGYKWLYQSVSVQSILGPTLSVAATQPGVALGIPFATLVFSFRSIVSERESGSIRYTAGTAITRYDILIGKTVGILFGVLLPAIVGIVLTILIGIGLVTKSVPSVAVVFFFCSATALYVAAFTSIGVAVSAFVRNSTQAFAFAFCTLLLGVFSWSIVEKFIFGMLSLLPFSERTQYTIWTFLSHLGIYNGFLVLTNDFLVHVNSRYMFDSAISIASSTNTSPLIQKFGSPLPFYLQPWFEVVILFGWLTIPFGVALYRFDDVDLTISGTSDSRFRNLIWKGRHVTHEFHKRVSAHLPVFRWFGTSRWGPLARREYRAVRQSLSPIIVFCLILGIGMLDFPTTNSWVVDHVGTTTAVATYQRGTAFIVLFAAIVLTFRSISGERDTGSITLTSGTAITRADLVLGKFIGRTIALLVPVYAALVVGIPLASMRYGVPSLGVILGFLLVVTLYTVVCTAIGVSISAITSKTISSSVLALVFVLLTYLWVKLGPAIYFFVSGQTGGLYLPPADPLLFLFSRLTPLESFFALTNGVFGTPNSSFVYNLSIPKPHVISDILIVDTTFNGNAPFYLHPWFSLIFLLCWLVVPLAIALIDFERSDIT